MNEEQDLAYYFEISTYMNLRENGEKVIALIEKIKEMYISKLNKPLLIGYTKSRTRKDVSLMFSEKNLQKVYLLLRNGEILHLGISEYYGDEYYEEDPYVQPPLPHIIAMFSVAFCLDENEHMKYFFKNSKEKPQFANKIALSVANFSNIEFIQDDFTQLFKEIAISSEAINGFITFETYMAGASLSTTDFENSYGLDYFISCRNHDKYARGYFWGNLLSSIHIELLGGIEYIQSNFHCEKVEEIYTDSNDKLVYIQLTKDINNYSDEELRKLRKLLLPILPTGKKKLKEPEIDRTIEYQNFDPSKKVFLRLLKEDQQE